MTFGTLLGIHTRASNSSSMQLSVTGFGYPGGDALVLIIEVVSTWHRGKVGSAMTDEISEWFGKYHLVDNITLDYFDIDTDPSGAFQPGQPYRCVAIRVV